MTQHNMPPVGGGMGGRERYGVCFFYLALEK